MKEHVIREGKGIMEPTHIPTASALESQSKHTAGPWYVGAQNDALYIITKPPRPSNDDIVDIPDVAVIASVNACNDEANAAFILRACNSHYDLLAACKEIASFAQSWQPLSPGDIAYVRAAIAKAEGR